MTEHSLEQKLTLPPPPPIQRSSKTHFETLGLNEWKKEIQTHSHRTIQYVLK